MITWPMGADQIFNEKLVTEVLKIGMPIGARKLFRLEGDSITCDAVEEAVKRIMIGEEAIEMRNRTKVPSQLAKQAMKGGGSSFTELEALVEESKIHEGLIVLPKQRLEPSPRKRFSVNEMME
ncbi:hypothetical protein AAZX31_20G012300 [Glycine max]